MEFKPEDVLRDRIHFSALLTSGDDVSVTVTVGGVDIAGAAFTRKPDGGVGVYQYVFPFPFLKPSNCLGRGYLTKVSSNPNLCQWKRRYKHLIGPVVVTMNRAGTIIGTVSGGPGITRECEQGVQNFNAWVGVDEGRDVVLRKRHPFPSKSRSASWAMDQVTFSTYAYSPANWVSGTSGFSRSF